jgi:hypothetical protein
VNIRRRWTSKFALLPLRHRLALTELSERGIHRSGSGISHIEEHVRIDIQGKAYIGVA